MNDRREADYLLLFFYGIIVAFRKCPERKGKTMEILLAAALLPPLVLLFVLYKEDKIEKEPLSLLTGLFVLGALTVVSAIVIGTLADRLEPEAEERARLEAEEAARRAEEEARRAEEEARRAAEQAALAPTPSPEPQVTGGADMGMLGILAIAAVAAAVIMCGLGVFLLLRRQV